MAASDRSVSSSSSLARLSWTRMISALGVRPMTCFMQRSSRLRDMGTDLERLGDRRGLLAGFDSLRRELDFNSGLEGADLFPRQAVTILTSSKLAEGPLPWTGAGPPASDNTLTASSRWTTG